MEVPTKTKEKKPRCYFSPEEDQQLVDLHKQYGSDWSRISSILQTKNPRQCRDRYMLYLANERNDAPFTEDEIARLQKLVEKYGHKWRMLSCAFERSEIQLKNLWKIICRRQQRAKRRALKEEEVLKASREIDEEIAQEKRQKEAEETSSNANSTTQQINSDFMALRDDSDESQLSTGLLPTPNIIQPPTTNRISVIIPGKIETEAAPQIPVSDFMKALASRPI